MRFSWPSHGTIIAYVALFVALGGTAVAGVALEKGSVGTSAVQKGAITTGKLAKEAVTASKLASRSVKSRHLKAGAVDAKGLASNAVTSDAVRAGSLDFDALGSVVSTTVEVDNGLNANQCILDPVPVNGYNPANEDVLILPTGGYQWNNFILAGWGPGTVFNTAGYVAVQVCNSTSDAMPPTSLPLNVLVYQE